MGPKEPVRNKFERKSYCEISQILNCDLMTTVQCSNQLRYEVTDVGSWSFVHLREPLRNKCEVIVWNISCIELQM